MRRGKLRWFGHLDVVKVRMIGCQPGEMCWWRGRMCRQRQEDLGRVCEGWHEIACASQYALLNLYYILYGMTWWQGHQTRFLLYFYYYYFSVITLISYGPQNQCCNEVPVYVFPFINLFDYVYSNSIDCIFSNSMQCRIWFLRFCIYFLHLLFFYILHLLFRMKSHQ